MGLFSGTVVKEPDMPILVRGDCEWKRRMGHYFSDEAYISSIL